MRQKRLFIILFVLALFLFVLDQKGFLVPLRGKIERQVNPAQARIYSWTKRPGEFIKSLLKKEGDLEKIKEKERELESCRYATETLRKENEDMRRLLQAPLPKSWAFLPAKVLGKKRHLVIDKGENDGTRKGMIVVYENFLVGKVVKTNPLSSLVALPFDSESKIAAKTESGARGLLEGRFGTKIFLTRVLQKESLLIGSLVVTTGEGDYLPDLLVGKIKDESKESQEPFQEVEVEPGLSYGELTTVFLVRD